MAKPMIRLLVITTISSTLQSFFGPLAHHLRARGWQVDGMAQGASTSPECIGRFDKVWDIKLSRNPLDPRNLLVVPSKIRAAFLQEQYDLVQVSTPIAAFVARYVLNDFRRQGKPKVIYTAQGFHFYQGGSLSKNMIFRSLEQLAGPWTDHLVVVNREDEAAAKQYRIVPPKQIHLIPGTGINTARFNPEAISEAEVTRVRQELGLQQSTPLFLSVMEFIPRKRPWDVLNAFARLAHPDAHLAFAGDGRILGEMKKLSSELGIQNQVHFLGVRRDVPTLIRASLATILASEQEGLPNCVMESLYLETPVIGTNIRGTRDLLEGGSGFLVKVGDEEAIAQSMAQVLDNPEKALLMGKQGRERMADYDLPTILKQYESLYLEVLGKQHSMFNSAQI